MSKPHSSGTSSHDAPPSLTRVVQSALREYLAARGHGVQTRSLVLTPAEHGSGGADLGVEHDRDIAGR